MYQYYEVYPWVTRLVIKLHLGRLKLIEKCNVDSLLLYLDVVLQRKSVFTWLAAVAVDLGKEELPSYLPLMMAPLVREFTSSKDGKVPSYLPLMMAPLVREFTSSKDGKVPMAGCGRCNSSSRDIKYFVSSVTLTTSNDSVKDIECVSSFLGCSLVRTRLAIFLFRIVI